VKWSALALSRFVGGSISPSCRCTIDLERCTAQRAPRSAPKALVRLVGGSRLSGISKLLSFVLKKVAEPLQAVLVVTVVALGRRPNVRVHPRSRGRSAGRREGQRAVGCNA
jgi:hypothetical protein